MVKRTVGGAHYGIRDWLVQRVTAAVMAVYTLFLLGFLLTHQPLDFAAWQGLFRSEPVRLASLIFLFSVFLHAWIGVRDILMDYVHPVVLRLFFQVGTILALVAYAAWAAQILWSLP